MLNCVYGAVNRTTKEVLNLFLTVLFIVITAICVFGIYKKKGCILS